MKSFEYIADIWLKSELFGKQYSYRKGLEKDVEHLVAYFGNRNCEDIKGMDVDRFIQYESEHLNPNTGKPFSKRLMKAHLSAGLGFCFIFGFSTVRNIYFSKKFQTFKKSPIFAKKLQRSVCYTLVTVKGNTKLPGTNERKS